MKIERMGIDAYRNLEHLVLDFDDVNVIYGENAQGKTNLLQNLVYAAIGILLGTPLGLYLVYIMISTSGDSFDMMVKLTPVSFIICAVITLVVSTLVSLLFTRYIKKLDMVTSLKGVE